MTEDNSEIIQKKKKKTTYKYIERIKNPSSELVRPTYNPVLPNSEEYNVEVWKNYNLNLHKKITQEKVNLNWIEVCSRYSQFKTLYNDIKDKDLGEKQINKLIRETIPNYENIYSRTTFWRKAYDNICLILKASVERNISDEKILEKFRESQITINFFQEADKTDIEDLINCLV
ncbi:13311_t:CDS:2 [Gigaspora rosea]|nr:13311_t:CDS:2 [Gigaspora rosea]